MNAIIGTRCENCGYNRRMTNNERCWFCLVDNALNEREMRKAFKTSIQENPKDPTPRLIYADWLEENNYPDEAKLQREYPEIRRKALLATNNALRESRQVSGHSDRAAHREAGYYHTEASHLHTIAAKHALAMKERGTALKHSLLAYRHSYAAQVHEDRDVPMTTAEFREKPSAQEHYDAYGHHTEMDNPELAALHFRRSEKG